MSNLRPSEIAALTIVEWPDLPLPSWRDPDHPLFKEFEEAYREAFPLPDQPPPRELTSSEAIAEALRAIAQPNTIGYERTVEVYQALEDGGMGGHCTYGGPYADTCAYGTRRCPIRHHHAKADGA